jgi:hypothetical protein
MICLLTVVVRPVRIRNLRLAYGMRMKIVLFPFMVLAAVGFVLSLIVHVTALFGIPSPLGEFSWLLHMGIFVVWLPTVIVSNRRVKDSRQKDFWKVALRGCPQWMKRLTQLCFIYAIINFILFMIFDIAGGGANGSEDGTPPGILRGFSGHWMAFYSAAMAVLYSAIHANEHDSARRCPNGHPVPPTAEFCEQCGSEVIDPRLLR